MAFFDRLFNIESETEIGTKKEQNTYTTTNTSSSTYSPTVSRVYDFQYNIASEGSTVSTKKEADISQTPATSTSQTPSLAISPSQSSKLISGATGQDSSMTDFVIVGALVVGAVMILPQIFSKPKLPQNINIGSKK